TAKVLLALAVTLAAATGIGSLLGLPLPGSGPKDASSQASIVPVLGDSGSAPLSPDGPFYPVQGPVSYGAFDAHFGGGRGHPGQDMLTKKGTPIVAVRTGTIIDGGSINGQYSGGRGNYLYLWSPQDKRTYVYEHMLHPSPLKVGDHVTAGEY